ncbi:MAG: CHAT domain-containing protein [Geminocystis sp. GBBB08]|nr:CHAT domain-containing protein [Geminocystis sp. GBBB08]
MASVYDNLRKYPEALNYYQQALTLVKEIGNRSGEGDTYANIGFLFAKQNNFSESEKYLTSAIEVFESLNSKKLQDTDKISLFDRYINNYSILQKVLIKQNKTLPALEIAERGRASAFKELLAKQISPQETPITIPTISQIQNTAKTQKATFVQYSIIRDEFDVNGKKEWLDSQLYIWVIKPDGDIQFRSVNLQEKNVKLAQLIPQFRTYLGIRGDNKIAYKIGDKVRLKSDRSRDLKYDPWVIVSVNADKGIIQVTNPLWNDQKQTKEITINDINQDADLSNSLQKLHQILIEPIADLLPKNPEEKVIFIPQKELFGVPFPALADSNNQYLIEKHTILTAPSIQVLDSTHKLRQKPVNNAQNILIVGNPSPMPSGWQPLKYSETEAKEVAQILQTQPILGNQATKANIIKQLPQAKIIHFATHGTFADQNGLDSYIVLGVTNSKNTNNNDIVTTTKTDNGILRSADNSEIFTPKNTNNDDILTTANINNNDISTTRNNNNSDILTTGNIDNNGISTTRNNNNSDILTTGNINNNDISTPRNNNNSDILTTANIDNNGILTAAEIFNLFEKNQLSAELAILSACETGRGEITGDGVIGLSRSLISAGVPSVIVSLWAVDDLATSELMVEFYKQLKLTGNKATALRNAMLVTKQKHPDPRLWAGFTLIGEAE